MLQCFSCIKFIFPNFRKPSIKSCLYWSLCVVFCCFGHLQTIFLQYLYLFPQAFEATASSSGGIQTLIDEYTNQDIKITTIESESYTCKRAKVKFLTPTFKQTIPRRWLLKKVLDHPDFHSSPTAAPPSPPAPPARISPSSWASWFSDLSTWGRTTPPPPPMGRDN